jgi:hypothetical protein
MRKYSSTIPAMTLGAQLSAGATSITLNTGAWPTVSSPDTLTLVIEPDTANEEIVYVTAHTSGSSSATIIRAQESTADITHANGSAVKHMITGADLQEAHTHMAATNYSSNGNVALHGIGTGEGAVVGTDKTQTLKNKTINVGGADNNSIGGLTVSNVSGIAGTYAPLASPNFTGTPTISGNAIATQAYAQPVDADLTALGNVSTTGLIVRTGAGAFATRTLVAGTNITLTNPDGTGDNITINATAGTSGVSSIAGTTNQISASASTGAVTLSLPSSLVLPSATVATTQTSTDNSTKVATTAYVTTAVAAVSGGDVIARYVRSTDTSNISSATAMFAASNSLTANTLYKFKYVVFAYFNYSGTSGTISFTHAFTQTPQEITWMFNNANDLLTGQNTVATATVVSNSITGSGGDYIEVEGYFKTNATTGGTFSPQVSTSAGTVNIKKGSFVELLSISAAGSWI